MIVHELKKPGYIAPGIIWHGSDVTLIRIVPSAGYIDPDMFEKIGEIVKKFEANIFISLRANIEVHIKTEQAFECADELKSSGLDLSSVGKMCRKEGFCTDLEGQCKYSIEEPIQLAMQIKKNCDKVREETGGKDLPHKLKHGVSGCIKACNFVTAINDIAVVAVMNPIIADKFCKVNCKACLEICEEKALKFSQIEVNKSWNNNKIEIDKNLCSRCGMCVKICPTQRLTGSVLYDVYIGGKHGRDIQLGKRYLMNVDREHVLAIALGVRAFFDKYGLFEERLHYTIVRVGENVFRREVIKEN